jgi:rhomboid family GlyGly-CTERM serine protease
MAGEQPVHRTQAVLQSLYIDGKRGLLLAAVLLALVVPAALGPELQALLRYDRDALAGGQWWRWISGHLVHLDLEHALLNGIGLALLWTLFAGLLRGRDWLAIVLLSMLSIDLGLWFGQPQLLWYVGASGVLHGIMAAGCVQLLRHRDRIAWPTALIFAGKLVYEQWQGPLPFETHAVVIVQAHLYGALGGLLAALLPLGLTAILRARNTVDQT